jgi:hypothetical protein
MLTSSVGLHCRQPDAGKNLKYEALKEMDAQAELARTQGQQQLEILCRRIGWMNETTRLANGGSYVPGNVFQANRLSSPLRIP